MSSCCCVDIVLNVKKMTLEPINDSVAGLASIFCIASMAFKEINEIITLTIGLYCGVVFGISMQFDYSPLLGNVLQY